MALSTILSISPQISFWSKFERMTGLLMLFHLFAFFIVLSSVYEKKDFKYLFLFSSIIALIVGLFAVYNVQRIEMRGGGTIGNESFLGTYLLFNLFFLLYLIFNSSKEERWIYILIFVLLLFTFLFSGVLLTNLSLKQKFLAIFITAGARAAKLSFYGGIILILIIKMASSSKRFIRVAGFLLLLLSFILVSVAGYYFMFSENPILRERLEKYVGTLSGRFYVWKIATRAFWEKPILGWGPETFEFAFLKHYDPCLGTPRCGFDIMYDRAHNIIFDTLVSMGLLGFIALSLVFAMAIFLLWKDYLSKKINFSTMAIFVALICAYLVQNLTVFDMVSSYLMLFLTLSFISATSVSPQRDIKEQRKKVEIAAPEDYVKIAFSVLFFLMMLWYFVIRPLQLDILLIKISTTRDPKLKYYKRIFAFPLPGEHQNIQFLAEKKIDEFKIVLRTGRKPTPSFFEEADFLISKLKFYINKFPLDVRLRLHLAEILNLYSFFKKEKIKEAEEVLKETIETFPTYQGGYWALSRVMLLQGENEEAISFAQKAVDLEPQLKFSHFFLIELLTELHMEERAKEKAMEAIHINPEWEEQVNELLREKIK